MRQKKGGNFLSLPLFALINFFSFSRERKKFRYFRAFEKKVEKNNEKEQKTEQNENSSLSPSHSSLKLRVNRTTTIYISFKLS